MPIVLSVGAADHGVRLPALDHDGGDDRGVGADDGAGVVGGGALAFHQSQVGIAVIGVSGIVLRIDHFHVPAGFKSQAQFGDAARDHVRPADQDRLGQSVVDHHLDGAQHPQCLAFGVDQALGLPGGGVEDRLHEHPGTEDEAAEALLVGVEVLDRTGRHAALHGRLGDRGRDFHDQPQVEGLGNQVFGAELQIFAPVGVGHDLGRFRHGQVGDRLDRGQLHLFVDGGGADVQGAAEDEGKAQHVVDLVGIVGPSGGDHGVRTDCLRLVGIYFRVGVGERQDEGLVGHSLDHVGGQDSGRGQAKEYVRVVDDLIEGTSLGVDGVAFLVGVHGLLSSLVDHSHVVHQGDVFLE